MLHQVLLPVVTNGGTTTSKPPKIDTWADEYCMSLLENHWNQFKSYELVNGGATAPKPPKIETSSRFGNN